MGSLNLNTAAKNAARPPWGNMVEAPKVSGDPRALSESDYALAAHTIGCDIATIKAVAEAESSGRGLLPDGRPAILFEAHVFHRLTGGRFADARDRHNVPLSVPRWDRTLYGKGGERQYERLEDAKNLDERAAVMACSWGEFQIMGFNFAALGFADVDTFREFIEATDSRSEQLALFVKFVMVNGLDDELRARDWKSFARQYNGPQYAANQYDVKMARAYQKHAGGA